MDNTAREEVQIDGYYPGVLGQVTRVHAVYYHDYWGFDISFETQVGKELSQFMIDFQENRDVFRSAIVNNEFAGAVAIDGSLSETEGARLRWFIVDPKFQGLGIGHKLIRAALDFCKQANHNRIFLWTFEGLDPARRLYEREGFQLIEENRLDQWGSTITEQKFELGL